MRVTRSPSDELIPTLISIATAPESEATAVSVGPRRKLLKVLSASYIVADLTLARFIPVYDDVRKAETH